LEFLNLKIKIFKEKK